MVGGGGKERNRNVKAYRLSITTPTLFEREHFVILNTLLLLQIFLIANRTEKTLAKFWRKVQSKNPPSKIRKKAGRKKTVK
jgi:hypothetical protein